MGQPAQRVSGTVLGIVTISSMNVGSPRTRGRLHESLVARRSITRVNDGWPTTPSVRSRAVIVDNELGGDVQEAFLGQWLPASRELREQGAVHLVSDVHQ